MSIFSGIETAQVTGGSQYLQPGQHRLRVKAITHRESSHKNTDYFVAEFTVVESTSESHAENSTATWLVDLNKPTRETALGNVKEFTAALLKVTLAEVTEGVVVGMISGSQPAVGMTVCAEAWHKPTKAGGVYTSVTWTAFPIGTDAEAH